VAECLAAVLESAARLYAADPSARGCLVLAGTSAHDEGARTAACAAHAGAEDLVRAYVAARHPALAERLTDFVSLTMVGLSAKARQGVPLDRLVETARTASLAIDRLLPG
jgi:TetR/AcrR family transcriptional repressor for divergent bdcA